MENRINIIRREIALKEQTGGAPGKNPDPSPMMLPMAPNAFGDRVQASLFQDSRNTALNNADYDFVDAIAPQKLEDIVCEAIEELHPELEMKSQFQDFFQESEHNSVLDLLNQPTRNNSATDLVQSLIRIYANLNPKLASAVEKVEAEDIGASQESLVQNLRDSFKYLLAAVDLDDESDNPKSFLKLTFAQLPSLPALHARIVKEML